MNVSAIEIDARTDLRPSEVSGSALRQVRKLMDDLSLRVVAVRFRTRRGYDDLDELDRRIASTKQAMKMAYDLGAGLVVNQVGRISDDPLSDSHDVLRAALSDLGRYGQHVGAILACETGSESLTALGNMIDALPDSTLGITLNPGNLLVNGFGLEDLGSVARHVRLVHAKDGVKDLARGRGMEVALGRGLAEFPEIAAILEERHFPGWYIVEREQCQNPIEEVATAVSFLRNM